MKVVITSFLLQLWVGTLHAQTPEATVEAFDQLIRRVIELDSIDLSQSVKFRAGLEPLLAAEDADESAMKVLVDPFVPQGEGKPGAFGWYRVRFTVPDKIGAFSLENRAFAFGIETNCHGSWEVYTYVNGEPAGAGKGVLTTQNRLPHEWVSNAPMLAKAGDKITLAVLAWSTPLAKGHPDGFGLRHLRLRFASRHTFPRVALFGNPVSGTGLHGARQKLATLKGQELQDVQAKLREPLREMDNVFESAKSGKLDDLSLAMDQAAKVITAALK